MTRQSELHDELVAVLLVILWVVGLVFSPVWLVAAIFTGEWLLAACFVMFWTPFFWVTRMVARTLDALR